MVCCTDYLKRNGAKVLVIMTVCQMVYFICYSIIYTVNWNKKNKSTSEDSHFISADDLFRWNTEFILVAGMIYFLLSSVVGKAKNPNELISYLVLAILCNFFFLYRLCIDAFLISTDYLNNPDVENDGLTITEYVMCFIAIIAVVFMIILIGITIRPLHEGMYEQIFWQIGGNYNMIEAHKAKSMYHAMLKVDLVIVLLYTNTFCFLAYDMQLRYSDVVNNAWYWVSSVVIAVLSILNNLHGHLMVKKRRLLYRMPYYVGRVLIEIAYIYIAVNTVLEKTIAWDDLNVEADDSLYQRCYIYMIIISVAGIISFLAVVKSAIKAFKVIGDTSGEVVRVKDQQDTYQPIINQSQKQKSQF